MSDIIELVIKISEDEYRNILLTGKASFCVVNAIEAGTILPKGHGRLKDVDVILDTLGCSDRDIYVRECIEEDSPTIIEADKAESEDKE